MEATQKKSALSVNMTEGSLWKNMLLFSLPLMLTQVLEVLFNLCLLYTSPSPRD